MWIIWKVDVFSSSHNSVGWRGKGLWEIVWEIFIISLRICYKTWKSLKFNWIIIQAWKVTSNRSQLELQNSKRPPKFEKLKTAIISTSWFFAMSLNMIPKFKKNKKNVWSPISYHCVEQKFRGTYQPVSFLRILYPNVRILYSSL